MKGNEKKKSDNALIPALKQEFRNLGALIEDNNHKLSAVAEQVGDILVRTTNIEMNIDVIKSDVEIIKNSLKRKVDIEDFEALVRRVSVLEKRVIK